MWPNTFEIVTALTLAVISTIIVLYFIVLKRKGWLTDESSPEMSYLCPNPECRKVFQKPVALTDFSTSPPQGYLACPHCGRDLEGTSTNMPEVSKTDGALPPKEPQLYTEDIVLRTEELELETPNETKIPQVQEAPKPTFSADTLGDLRHVSLRRTKSVKRPSRQKAAPKKHKEKKHSKKHKEKKHSKSSLTCPHFFGYVGTLSKDTSVPDECLWCPRLVKCLQAARR